MGTFLLNGLLGRLHDTKIMVQPLYTFVGLFIDDCVPMPRAKPAERGRYQRWPETKAVVSRVLILHPNCFLFLSRVRGRFVRTFTPSLVSRTVRRSYTLNRWQVHNARLKQTQFTNSSCWQTSATKAVREARGVERRLRGESSRMEELTEEEERMLAKYLRELAMKVRADW